MKYNFEEKKKMVTVAATVMFVCISGIIFVVSGRAECGVSTQKNVISDKVITETAIADKSEDVQIVNGEGEDYYAGEIVVHICGAVKNPGVYTFKENVRLTDVICEAGGYKKNAAKDYLNLAEPVSGGQKIVVYTKKQIKNKQNMQENDDLNRSSNIVNINSASKEELMNIPGIGESKAQDIINYREENGSFKQTEEIMNIPGIKEGIYSKISDMITI